MKKNNNILCIIGFMILLFSGCQSQTPTADDFVGTWEGEDGAMFEFFEDGTVSMKNIRDDSFRFFVNPTCEIFSGTGTWETQHYPIIADGIFI